MSNNTNEGGPITVVNGTVDQEMRNCFNVNTAIT